MLMYKNLLSIVLVVSFILTPFTQLSAKSSGTSTRILEQQLVAVERYLARTTGGGETPTAENLRTSIENGVTWFKNAQETNGHFLYEYVPYEGRYREDDNIVRQAGALYALGEIVARTDGDTLALKETLERSIGYFESISKEGTYGNHTFRCIPKSESSIRCPLGATSLALIGILSYMEAFPKHASTYEALADDYLTYILAMQKSEGGFRDQFSTRLKVQRDDESAFSNGEALLALVRAYTHTPDPTLKTAVDHAYTYLEAQPFDANLYLWIMAAVKDMHVLWPHEKYVTYAQKFTDWRIERNWSARNSVHNYCPYAEGLASALSIIGSSSSTKGVSMRAELDTLNARHLLLQITPADSWSLQYEKDAFTFKQLSDLRPAKGGFLTGRDEPTQRIDFTQHCINAHLQTLVDLDGEALR